METTNKLNLLRAQRRAGAKFGFAIHLMVYLAVIAFLAIINLATSASYLWFLWPAAGWGLGLLFHGISISLFSTDNSLYASLLEKELKRGHSD